MKAALAEKALGKGIGEGAVIERGGRIIARACAKAHGASLPSTHAEIAAIHEAALASGSFDLASSTLYVSGKPCPMCLGAVLWAHIGKVVYLDLDGSFRELNEDDCLRIYDGFLKEGSKAIRR
jgi:tRNA(Arg) A34 adenosine deaminase TadA